MARDSAFSGDRWVSRHARYIRLRLSRRARIGVAWNSLRFHSAHASPIVQLSAFVQLTFFLRVSKAVKKRAWKIRKQVEQSVQKASRAAKSENTFLDKRFPFDY